MSVVKHISDDIAVMYLGQMVEKAPSDLLFKNPIHPYTKALLSAIPLPVVGKDKPKRQLIKGEITSRSICRMSAGLESAATMSRSAARRAIRGFGRSNRTILSPAAVSRAVGTEMEM